MTDWPPQSAFFGVAILVSLAAAILGARAARRDPVEAFAVHSMILVGAALGARLMWGLVAPQAGLEAVSRDPSLLWHPTRGGFASLGGALGVGLVFGLATRRRPRAYTRSLLDLTVPACLLGLAVARLGCMANGCDFGQPMAGGWRYPAGSSAWLAHAESGLISLQATSSRATFPWPAVMSGLTVALVVAARWWPRGAPLGQRGLACAGGYLILRTCLEFLRDPSTVDSAWTFGVFNINQSICVVGLLLVVITWHRWYPGKVSRGVLR